MKFQTASRPSTVSDSGHSGSARISTSGSFSASPASLSRRLKASIAFRAISTFSCDIAYSDSPAALRASALLSSDSHLTMRPRRKVHTWY